LVNVQAVPTNFAGRTTTIPETTAAALGLLALGMMVLLRKRN
jgi:MYXO-CTERM domain-containing protein